MTSLISLRAGRKIAGDASSWRARRQQRHLACATSSADRRSSSSSSATAVIRRSRGKFNAVLLDAPCSATGTIRKNPEIKWRLREPDLASFASLQRELLQSALDLAAESVVYSTCSLEPEENDAVVDDVLRSRGDFVRGDVAEFANENVARWVQNGVLRLTPEAGTDGFTAHVLRRVRE